MGKKVSASTRYQLMPALSASDYLALKNSMAANGVLVAVDLDGDGHVIDVITGCRRTRGPAPKTIPA